MPHVPKTKVHSVYCSPVVRFLALWGKYLLHVFDQALTNPCKGEPSVVEKVLHGNVTAQVRKQESAVIGAVFCGSIAQRTHFLGIVYKRIEAFHAAAGCSSCR